MKTTVLILALTLGTLAVFEYNSNRPDTGTSTSEVSDQTNVPAPKFDLVDVSGGRMKSADIKGKVAVIDIWATWCAPCILEIPNFNKLHGDPRQDQTQSRAV